MDSKIDGSVPGKAVSGLPNDDEECSVTLKGVKYEVGEDGVVDLTGRRIPTVPIAELSEGIIYTKFGKQFQVMFDPEEKRNVSFDTYVESIGYRGKVSLWILGRIISLSIKAARRRNPSIRDTSSQPSDSVLGAGFTAHIDADNLNELFKKASQLETEIMGPVFACEKLVDDFVKGMQK